MSNKGKGVGGSGMTYKHWAAGTAPHALVNIVALRPLLARRRHGSSEVVKDGAVEKEGCAVRQSLYDTTRTHGA